MFDSIVADDVLSSIKILIKERSSYDTKYAVWYKGNLISPSAVISKIFKAKGLQIDRKSFTTIQAQSKLLELGFPIVDKTSEDNFFTETELNSFALLLTRTDYNPKSEVDRNIGDFLRETIWTKTKFWSDKLHELGWEIVGNRRAWNTRSTKKGFQKYKQYSWCSLKPYKKGNRLIFFTVGVEKDGSLEYKIDVQWNDKSFSDDQKHLFNSLKVKKKIHNKYIRKENLHSYNWDRLVNESNGFFEEHLDSYFDIYKRIWSEKRIMRIVWNDNGWTFPNRRNWKKTWQDKKDKAHHEKYGFGYEEWLFNKRYNIDGIQYGFIQGASKINLDSPFINELFLYSLEPKTKSPVLIGKLSNVNVVKASDLSKKIISVFDLNHTASIEELKSIGADFKQLKNNKQLPNISFSLNDCVLYPEPILITSDKMKIHRFTPRKIKGDLSDSLNLIEEQASTPEIQIKEGNGTGTNYYSQNTTGGVRNVKRTHSNITNDLYKFLKIDSSFSNFKISIEKTKVGNNLVDGLAFNENGKIFFEVKTTQSVLQNIRLALGQILEYALLDKNVRVIELIIVGPGIPSKIDVDYIARLRKELRIPLSYWYYVGEDVAMSKRFIKY